MLAALERDVQLGKVGVIDPFAKHRREPIATHLADYATHLKNKGVSPKGQSEETRKLKAVVEGCKFRTLADIVPEPIVAFLGTLATVRKVSSRTQNTYLGSIKSFVRWCVKVKRLGENNLACIDPIKGEVRRKRRALSEEELIKHP